MNLGNISKAIAAGVSSGAASGGMGAVMLPEGSPWYAYVLMALVPLVVSAWITYAAPKNTPA